MSTRFQRWILPGFAFKAVVIGGGYATGRELAEFFLPHGPWGGLAAMGIAALIWSMLCAATFAFAHLFNALEYKGFFKSLLGPGWIAFEILYVCFAILIISVFGAAAGEIGHSLAGLPNFVGTLCLMFGIIVAVALGNSAVELVFKYVTFGLYAIYVAFIALAFLRFGEKIPEGFAQPSSYDGFLYSGLNYASYNVIGAVIIIPVLRHINSTKDALISGVLSGPLAILPAVLFYIAMVAYYPLIKDQALPSDFLLREIGSPVFRILFQAMIFAALLESGAGTVNALVQRFGRNLQSSPAGRKGQLWNRIMLPIALVVIPVFFAEKIGLVQLIASGYRWLATAMLVVFVIPLLTIGMFRVASRLRSMAHHNAVSD